MDYNTEMHFVRCLKCHKILKCSRYDTTALLDHIRSDHPEIEIVDSVSKNASGPTPEDQQHGGGGGGGGLPPNMAELAKLARANGVPESTLQAMHKQAMQNQSSAGTNTNANTNVNSNVRDDCSPEIKVCDGIGASEGNFMQQDSEPNLLYTRSYNLHSPKPRTPRRKKLYRTSIERWRPGKGTIYCPQCCCNKRPLIKTRTERFAANTCSAACILGCWPFCFLPCFLPNDEKEYLHCSNCKNFLGLYDRTNNCIKPNKEFVECVTEQTTYKNE